MWQTKSHCTLYLKEKKNPTNEREKRQITKTKNIGVPTEKMATEQTQKGNSQMMNYRIQ